MRARPQVKKIRGDQPDISDVIYVGEVTDEALARLLAVPAKNDARHALVISSPDLSAPLPKESPATWQFQLASQTKREPGPSAWPVGNRSSQWQRSFHELLQLLAPERVAHAHGAAYNGDAYYLVISDADSKPQTAGVYQRDVIYSRSRRLAELGAGAATVDPDDHLRHLRDERRARGRRTVRGRDVLVSNRVELGVRTGYGSLPQISTPSA